MRESRRGMEMLQPGHQECVQTKTGQCRRSTASKWGTPRRHQWLEVVRWRATTGPIEDVVDLPGDNKELTKVLKLRKNLSEEIQEAISTFLKNNLDVFTWKHSDMEGIDPKVMCHRLNLDSNKKPIRQKRRVMDTEWYQALKDEVDKLLACNFIKESFYPSWLANPVLVKKT